MTFPATSRRALLLAAATVWLGAFAPAASRAERPNIVLVYVDDLRADGLSATGNPYLETPNLDRIAREGALFPRSYVTTSLCCPGRASVLTGKYAHKTGVTDNQPERDFLDDHRTVADLLGEAGYETAFIGKWHLPNPGAAPRRGFDHWVSFEGQGEYFDQALNVDGTRRASRGFVTDVLADYATRFIERERGERPFLLVLSLKNCHSPHLPPARHRGRLDGTPMTLPPSFDDDPEALPTTHREARLNRRNRGAHPHPELYEITVRRYWELVLSVDEAVGHLLATLERRGVADETCVAFTSDNGYLLGEHGLIQKGFAYEPSIRVPLCVRYPDRIPAGSVVDSVTLNVDLAPTFLELAGLAVGADVQGRSLLGAIEGAGGARDDFLYLAPWFHKDGTPRELALAGGRYKYVRLRSAGLKEQLFDLEADPGERTDLSADERLADVLAASRERMRELMGELEVPPEWFESE
ncbi:MAG: sulfatase [Planctomycetota bacterium]|jgi:N-acetylglucosamine-6-sulfatase|nr:sulfatase [Planctomycetota bacterium]MDP6989594.1 sulfatase [Planctomycetota bacterium]